MTLTITMLILSAICHASWNIISKGAKDKLTFLWCQIMFAVVSLAVPILLFCKMPDVKGLPFLLVSGILQTAYYFLLAKTYSIGEISVVYPLTRGSAPLFVTIASGLLGAEVVTLPMLLSVVLIFAGIYVVNMKKLSLKEFAAPLKTLVKVPQSRLALINGLIVAGYTLSDNQSVEYCDPLLIYWIITMIPAIALAPMIIKRGMLKDEVKTNIKKIIPVSILTFAAYFLVLLAMKNGNASYISSVREVSIVFVAIYSAVCLKEGFALPKTIGAIAIFIGIFLLSIFSM